MTTATMPQEARHFLRALFQLCEHNVEFRACMNEHGGGARSLFSGEADEIAPFIAQQDVDGKGVYVGVSSRRLGSPTGARRDCAETPAVWVDIDTRKMGIEKEVAVEALKNAQLMPSIVVDSGNGIHAYWLLREPAIIDTQSDEGEENETRLVAVMRQLVGVLAGDVKVAELARIMRLPGTHNSKQVAKDANDGKPIPCVMLWCEADRQYDLHELEDWLSIQRPLIAVPAGQEKGDVAARLAELPPEDPFVRYARQAAIRVPLDAQRELARMNYGAAGDAGVHSTQLRVSGHMVQRGVEDEEIVAAVMQATIAAAGFQGHNWNWRREEQKIRRMIDGARARGFDKPKGGAATGTAARGKQPPAAGGGGGGAARGVEEAAAGGAGADEERPADVRVASLAVARAKKAHDQRAKRMGDAAVAEGEPVAAAGVAAQGASATDIDEVARAVIAKVEAERGKIIVVDGEFFGETQGYWTRFDGAAEHHLRVEVSGMTVALGKRPAPNFLNGVSRRIHEMPSLQRPRLKFDQLGWIACNDASINVGTGEIAPHDPEHYTTISVPCEILKPTGTTITEERLGELFSNRPPEEARKAVDLIQEFYGAGLVRGKSKELSKALFIIGKDNTGKSTTSKIMRNLMGGTDRCSSIALAQLEDRFGPQGLLDKIAWIRDDAIGEGDTLNPEVFKVVVSGEPLAIQRKNRPDVQVKLDIPVLLTANALPKIKDATNAVYRRLLVMPMTRQWTLSTGERPSDDVDAELFAEISGTLLWAIVGWHRLKARGCYDPPEFMIERMAVFKATNVPIQTFLTTCVVEDPEYFVDRKDMLAALNAYMNVEAGGDRRQAYGGHTLSRHLEVIYPHINAGWQSNGRKYVVGVKLTTEGLTAWQEAMLGDSAVCHSSSADGVNRRKTRM